MLSVLMFFGKRKRFSKESAASLISPSQAAGSKKRWFQFTNQRKKSCDKGSKNPLHQRNKNRYRSASLTVEASFAFPVFFFAVFYLLQMFVVLRGELNIASSGISSAREVAAYSYAVERLTDEDDAIASKLLDIFSQDVVKDATVTSLLMLRCDDELLSRGGVGQGYGGFWAHAEEEGGKTKVEIAYRVKATNPWGINRSNYYRLRLVYKDWAGDGKRKSNQTKEDVVYMTEHGTVYHTNRFCSSINVTVSGVSVAEVEQKRNASGAKYGACSFCAPELSSGRMVYITAKGTKYHATSSCSAITRNVKECSLEEVKDTYRQCSKCGKKEEGTK